LIEEQTEGVTESASTQTQSETLAQEIEEGKAAAILAYVPFMCFVPLVKMRQNQFALKHGKQGLILFLVEIVALIFLLPKISDLFWGFVIIACLALALAGILYAVQGREWKIPFLGDLADKFRI